MEMSRRSPQRSASSAANESHSPSHLESSQSATTTSPPGLSTPPAATSPPSPNLNCLRAACATRFARCDTRRETHRHSLLHPRRLPHLAGSTLVPPDFCFGSPARRSGRPRLGSPGATEQVRPAQRSCCPRSAGQSRSAQAARVRVAAVARPRYGRLDITPVMLRTAAGLPAAAAALALVITLAACGWRTGPRLEFLGQRRLQLEPDQPEPDPRRVAPVRPVRARQRRSELPPTLR